MGPDVFDLWQVRCLSKLRLEPDDLVMNRAGER